ncbi:MAG: aminodeoxychorismate/anthranilate synthase component II [Gammaproteobacteria bacterium]|nr:aminodeoxychorismate/anthranilate synthase component II [Gammaproteobacteria bacterium]
MILMIDNYDSFTYNLVHYCQSLGANLVVKRNDEVTIADIAALNPDKIMISPGPCDPSKAGISMAVIEAFAEKLPILGVCLGHQAIAQVFGANIVRAPKVMHGKTSEIHHRQHGVFQHLPSPFKATRYHSLCIENASLPQEFSLTAWTEEDGQADTIIMGIAHKSLSLQGVQFHPESIATECGMQLIKNFLQ